MTTKKIQTAVVEDTWFLKSEHWSIKRVAGYSEVSRFSKTFYIPDDEMVELHELLTAWRKEHDTDK